jgi:hypothetical protein
MKMKLSTRKQLLKESEMKLAEIRKSLNEAEPFKMKYIQPSKFDPSRTVLRKPVGAFSNSKTKSKVKDAVKKYKSSLQKSITELNSYSTLMDNLVKDMESGKTITISKAESIIKKTYVANQKSSINMTMAAIQEFVDSIQDIAE